MNLKRSNTGVLVCALTSIAILFATALTAAPALALSEGRVYEMVTPVYKGGYGVAFEAASPNGGNVLFNSLGVFAGVPRPEVGSKYMAQREAGKGWSTIPTQPPFANADLTEYSSTLEYGAGTSGLGETPIGAVGVSPIGENEAEFLWHRLGAPDTPENWEAFAPGVILRPAEAEVANLQGLIAFPIDSSSDLCHVAVEGVNLLPEAPFPDTVHYAAYQPYDLARGCRGEEPSLRLVGVRNRLGPHGEPEEIAQQCNAFLGSPTGGSGDLLGPFGREQSAHFNMVSGDGSEFFFMSTTDVKDVSKACGSQQLFVRVGGSRTVEVSRPVDPSLQFGGCGEGGKAGEVPGEVPCAGAALRLPSFFKGASEDGSRMFFATGERLLPGETDSSNKLYMARIGCPVSEPACEPAARRVTGLVDASKSQLAGETGEVQGVVSIAKNGERVYFVAHGVLTGAPNGQGVVAVKGADNLYVYDSETQGVSFIAALSANDEDILQSGLWGSAGEAQSTGDGSFLVFSSYARLIARGTQADTDNAKDVYRYDAQTGVLDRVSLGEAGSDANGNGSGFDATIPGLGVIGNGAGVVEQQGLANRAISEDGSRVVFSSVEPLSSAAINHHQNVYIWDKEPGWSEGRVSMISGGSSLTNDNYPVITPDGLNVFFSTSQGLVPADTESDLDVYDARVDGGFPEVAAERVQCSSDACQGALTNPAPLLVPGSVSQAPGQNFAAPVVVKAKAKAKPKKKKAKRKKSKAKKAGNNRRVK